ASALGDEAGAGALERPLGEEVEGSGEDPLPCAVGRRSLHPVLHDPACHGTTLSVDLTSCQTLVHMINHLHPKSAQGGEHICSDWSMLGVGRPSSTPLASTTWPGWPTTIRWRRRRRAWPVSRSCTSSHGAVKEKSRTGGSTRSSSAHRCPT